jgi:hypothetical protein
LASEKSLEKWISQKEPSLLARSAAITSRLQTRERHGWTQQIQVATGQLAVMQSDAITPVQSVPQSLATILSERKERSRLGLSRFAAEAAEQAAEHRDKLSISGKVKDVADVHKTLWPNQPETNQILNLGILIGTIRP